MVNFKKTNGWAKTSYILAGVSALMFIIMIFSTFKMMAQQAGQYGMTVMSAYGFGGALQYVLSSSFSYLVFAALLWGMGLILNKVLGEKAVKEEKEDVVDIEPVEAAAVPAIPEDVDGELSTQWKRQFNMW